MVSTCKRESFRQDYVLEIDTNTEGKRENCRNRWRAELATLGTPTPAKKEGRFFQRKCQATAASILLPWLFSYFLRPPFKPTEAFGYWHPLRLLANETCHHAPIHNGQNPYSNSFGWLFWSWWFTILGQRFKRGSRLYETALGRQVYCQKLYLICPLCHGWSLALPLTRRFYNRLCTFHIGKTARPWETRDENVHSRPSSRP